MIKLENTEVLGFEHAIRGMRNPMNSWDKSDSWRQEFGEYDWGMSKKDFDIHIGSEDLGLMLRLAKGGPVHAKYRRMITVYVDITAPLYWWKEFDTYKIGTVANSCSTMHKIHAKEFTLEDFSHEHLAVNDDLYINIKGSDAHMAILLLSQTIQVLNIYRERYLETKDKKYWWQMIQLLPASYNQKRTIMLNYEVLANIRGSRKNHKLDEWHIFCDWIEGLPYSNIIL